MKKSLKMDTELSALVADLAYTNETLKDDFPNILMILTEIKNKLTNSYQQARKENNLEYLKKFGEQFPQLVGLIDLIDESKNKIIKNDEKREGNVTIIENKAKDKIMEENAGQMQNSEIFEKSETFEKYETSKPIDISNYTPSSFYYPSCSIASISASSSASSDSSSLIHDPFLSLTSTISNIFSNVSQSATNYIQYHTKKAILTQERLELEAEFVKFTQKYDDFQKFKKMYIEEGDGEMKIMFKKMNAEIEKKQAGEMLKLNEKLDYLNRQEIELEKSYKY